MIIHNFLFSLIRYFLLAQVFMKVFEFLRNAQIWIKFDSPNFNLWIFYRTWANKKLRSSARVISCWNAWLDIGRWKIEADPSAETVDNTEMCIFLAKENNSGNLWLGTLFNQRSSHKRQLAPSLIWTIAKPLKESSNFKMSLHQKDPFFLVMLGRVPLL